MGEGLRGKCHLNFCHRLSISSHAEGERKRISPTATVMGLAAIRIGTGTANSSSEKRFVSYLAPRRSIYGGTM